MLDQLDKFTKDRRELVRERLGSVGPSPSNLSAINNNNNNTLDIDRESLPLIENSERGNLDDDHNNNNNDNNEMSPPFLLICFFLTI